MTFIPIVGNDFPAIPVISALLAPRRDRPLEAQLGGFLENRDCRLACCGFAALYALLASRKELFPERNEVILPAYAAPGLVLPVRRLGLTPVLCDIAPGGFLMDHRKTADLCGPRTLAVIAVHMFGLPLDVPNLTAVLPASQHVIEDCAQSLGSELHGKRTGTFAPASFGSFSRGKNFSLYYGGFLTFTDNKYRDSFARRNGLMHVDSAAAGRIALAKLAAFSLLTAPQVYAVTHRLLQRIKPTGEKLDFPARWFSSSARLSAADLFSLWLTSYEHRIANGRILHEALQKLPAVTVPDYPPSARIAFNRFPLMIPDAGRRLRLHRTLLKNGIESSFMYRRPVHHVFDLGYRPDELPHAVLLAERLLTLPVHGTVGRKFLDKMIDISYSILS